MVKKVKRIHPVKKTSHHTRVDRVRSVKQKEAEMDEGLRAIYGDNSDDLGRFTKSGSRLTYWLTRVVGLLSLAAIIIFSLTVVASKGWFLNQSFAPLTLAVQAPAEVVSGEAVTITIPYENPENVPLAKLEVNVNLPPSFIVTKTDPAPANEEELIFNLGSIGPRGKGTITLEGTWLVPSPSTNTIQAIASYKPANFSSDFSQIASASIGTKASILGLSVIGPDKATPGAELKYELRVMNLGLVTARGVGVSLSPPDGFTIANSTPAFTPGEPPKWALAEIEPGQEKVVTVIGTFASDVTDIEQMIAEVSFLTGSGLNTKTLVQAVGSVATDVSGGALRLTLVGNGLAGDTSVAPGDSLRLGYRLENTGDTPLTGATVTLDFQPGAGIPVVWSKANLDGGVMTKDGIVFDAKKIGTINPAEKKSFNLAFPLKADLTETDIDSFVVIARAVINGSTIQSSPLTVRVDAAVTFAASAHYFSTDGAPIGDGPLPPVVGSATTFEVMWTIKHALHPLEDLVVTATLPPGVTYAGGEASDLGRVSYDASANIVRLDATSIADNKGEINAKFYVKATPQAADVGKVMKILSGSALRVTDSVTANRLEKETESLTTALPNDPHAEGKGLVISN